MSDNRKSRIQRAGELARGATFAAQVLRRTGALSSLSAGGILRFARTARGTRPGPHMALTLHAACQPEKPALIDARPGRERRIDYQELEREINQLGHAFGRVGVRPGDRVALMLPNSAHYVIAQHALLRIGASAVQVGYRLKAPEIAYILDNAQPAAVLVHADYQDEMTEARRLAGGPDDAAVLVCGADRNTPIRGEHYDDALSRSDGRSAPAWQDPSTGSVIVYTSGTTGKPKGARRASKDTGLTPVADFMAKLGMHQDDRHLVVCPLYHSAAPAFVTMLLSLGGTSVIMEHFAAETVLATIARERITCAFMVPTMLVRLNALPAAVRRRHDVSSLRWVCSGAAPLATDTANRFQRLYGRVLYNFYGSTETGLVTVAGPDDHAARPGTVGRLLRGNEARLLDDDGSEVGPGEVGELYVKNSMLISGYHRNRKATDDSMRSGYFSVGDMARVDADGFYYLESRKRDMVISGGVNIYPREIEDYLHTHPEVSEAAVIGVPDPEWGESLLAFVVRTAGAHLDEAEVMRFCRDGLAGYKCPRQVRFLDALPHNPTGKVLKRELRERYSPT